MSNGHRHIAVSRRDLVGWRALKRRHELAVAIVIRCAGNGGRCNRQLGLAQAIPGRQPTSPVLGLSNQGWPTSHGYPLLEAAVPADFSGSTGIFSSCPKHGTLIIEKSAAKSRVRGLLGGRSARGISVQMPFALLRQAYEAFLRDGRAQTVLWTPGERATVYTTTS
jgi:hypothetical protein